MGHHPLFTLLLLDVRSRRNGCSRACLLSWGGNLCVWSTEPLRSAGPPRHPFRSGERPDGALPLCVFIFYSLEAIYKKGSHSCKTGVGVVIFSWKVARLSAKRKGMSPKACWQWAEPALLCLLSQPKQNATSAWKPGRRIPLCVPEMRHRKALGLQVWPGGHPGPLKVLFHPQELGVEGVDYRGIAHNSPNRLSKSPGACQKQPVHVEFEVWGEHKSIPSCPE